MYFENGAVNLILQLTVVTGRNWINKGSISSNNNTDISLFLLYL